MRFRRDHYTFLFDSSSPQLRISWVVDIISSFQGIKIPTWSLYGRIWSLGWKTQFLDRFRLLSTLLLVRMAGAMSLQGHTCSGYLLEEQKNVCLLRTSRGGIGEGRGRRASLLGFFCSLTDLVSRSGPFRED